MLASPAKQPSNRGSTVGTNKSPWMQARGSVINKLSVPMAITKASNAPKLGQKVEIDKFDINQDSGKQIIDKIKNN
jgi:hypothetical protein